MIVFVFYFIQIILSCKISGQDIGKCVKAT